MAEFKILSLDGGGIRGIYQSAFLDYIQRRTNEPLYKHFDMIVGTSTGAIITLALALGISTDKILIVQRESIGNISQKTALVYTGNYISEIL